MKRKAVNGLIKQCDCLQWSKCRHGWHFVGRVAGKRPSVSLDKYLDERGRDDKRATLADASVIAGEIRTAIRTGTYGKPVKPAPPAAADTRTVDALGKSFKLWLEGASKDGEPIVSLADEYGRLDKLAAVDVPDGVGRFGDVLLDAVTGDIVEAVYRSVSSGRANSTKRKYRRLLKRFFRWAVTKRHIGTSPITDDTRLPAGKNAVRDKRARPDVEAQLIDAANNSTNPAHAFAATRLAVLIVAAIETTCRRGELLALQWRDLLFVERHVVVRAEEIGARKTKRARVVLMTERLAPLLEYLKISPTGKPWQATDYVFGNEIGERVTSTRKAWQTAVLRAFGHTPQWTAKGGFAPASRAAWRAIDFRFHDLRHEAALRLVERGNPLHIAAKITGHASLTGLQTYLGVSADAALAEVAKRQAPAEPVTVLGRDGKPVTIGAGAADIDSKPTVNRQKTRKSAFAKPAGKSTNMLTH